MKTCPAGHEVSFAVARLIYPRSVDVEDDPGAFVCWRCNSYSRAGGGTWFQIDLDRHEIEWSEERYFEHDEEDRPVRRRKRKGRRR